MTSGIATAIKTKRSGAFRWYAFRLYSGGSTRLSYLAVLADTTVTGADVAAVLWEEKRG